MKRWGAYWAAAIENGVNMICWTCLAIFFGRWWIALFAALFVTSIKTKILVKKDDEPKESEAKYDCENCANHNSEYCRNCVSAYVNDELMAPSHWEPKEVE